MLNPEFTASTTDINAQLSENIQINQKYFDKDRYSKRLLVHILMDLHQFLAHSQMVSVKS